jgi:hypothetical protein
VSDAQAGYEKNHNLPRKRARRIRSGRSCKSGGKLIPLSINHPGNKETVLYDASAVKIKAFEAG